MERSFKPIPEELDSLSHQILDSAYKVHSALGPGLLENIYELFLMRELQKRNIPVERQVTCDVEFEGYKVDAGFRLDLLVDGRVIVEIKAVESLLPVHQAQLLSYLKLSGRPLGLLINFNVVSLKHGIKRLVL